MDKKEIIIKAVELVTFLFAAFGQFLLKIAPPDSRPFSFVIGISSLLLLAILLLLSSVAKKRRLKNVKRKWIIFSILLLVTGAVLGFIYKSKLDNNTVVFQSQSKEYMYVTGNTLTKDASEYMD
jgi:drug/metabolite transporter (DMT)-like permease